MPRHKRTFSRNRRSRSHSKREPQAQAPNEPRANEPSVLQTETFKQVALSAPDYLLDSPKDFATPKLKEHGEYLSILLKAEEHFKIDASAGSYPNKQVLYDYFKQLRLSDGTAPGDREAFYLATFSRPVRGKQGRHRKTVRP